MIMEFLALRLPALGVFHDELRRFKGVAKYLDDASHAGRMPRYERPGYRYVT